MIINYDLNNNLLFSLNKKDFDVEYYKKSKGPGGQKVNKTSSACRIIHKETGIRSESSSHRSREQNKKEAFNKLIKTEEFQLWLKIKISEIQGVSENIEKKIDNMMDEKNLKIEEKKDGKWEEIKKGDDIK